MEQLREDLGVNTTRLWRNILVVLDTCSSADAFGATDVSKHARGITVTPEMEEFKQHESYQCLAAAPCRSAAFCFDHGTALHTALRRAWLSSDGDGGAFSRGREGAAQWATIACVADRVSVELATLMKEAQQRLPDDQRRPDDNYVLRQSCLLVDFDGASLTTPANFWRLTRGTRSATSWRWYLLRWQVSLAASKSWRI